MFRLLTHMDWLRQFAFAAWLVTMVACPSRADEPRALSNRIDQLLDSTYWGPSVPLAGDLEFLRRIYLDLIGRGPTIEEVQAYRVKLEQRSNESQTIRREVIDDLLDRDEFSRQFARVFDVMFTERREKISVLEFRAFIRQWLADKKPLDELCREILASDGTSDQFRPAASFFINRDAEPNLMTRDIGRIFFGRDVQCAQCHDHPLVTEYEQAEYFGILSFVNRTYLFNDVKRGNVPLLGEKASGQLEFASVFFPKRGKSFAQPILPMAMALDNEPSFDSDTDAYLVTPDKERRAVPRFSRRQQLAVLATHSENHSFNRNLANRLWANLMGTGLVHPVDLHHAGNPPASSAVLTILADELIECEYDLREMVRQITRTRAYQRSQVAPELEAWQPPTETIEGLESDSKEMGRQLADLAQLQTRLSDELKEATTALEKAQAKVGRIQKQVDEDRTTLQKHITERDSLATKLTEIHKQKKPAEELVVSLTAEFAEYEKAVLLDSENQELTTVNDQLKIRLAKAKDANAGLDNQVNQLQDAVANAERRVDDLRGRIAALASRRVALSEFVVEARGVLRRVTGRRQALLDQESDCEQQKIRITTLKNWLSQREQARQFEKAGQHEQATESKRQLETLQSELLELWRRSYAFRSIRGLSPEQFTGATYTALEMYRPVSAKAQADWESSHQANSNERDDVRKREQFVSAALAANMWDTVEDLIVEQFAAPAGTPQDGFSVTIDQALTLQNDPAYQSWLKPAAGNLVERLIAIDDSSQLSEQLYLCTVCRLPDDEERTIVRDFLSDQAADRSRLVQELVWAVLASAEFRFIP